MRVLVRVVVGDQRVLVMSGRSRRSRAISIALRVARHALRRGGRPRRRASPRRAASGAPSATRATIASMLLLEAHVEHAVGFVEHQQLDAVEVDAAAVHVVLEAAGRGDDDVDRLAQLLQLPAEGHAADQARGAQALAAAVAVAWPSAPAARARASASAPACAGPCRARRGEPAQALQAGQHEGRGLAAAGLRRDQQVAAGERGGNRLALHRRGLGIAEAR